MGFLCKQAATEDEIAAPNAIDTVGDVFVDAFFADGQRPTSRDLSRAQAGSIIGGLLFPTITSPITVKLFKDGLRDIGRWRKNMTARMSQLPMDKLIAGGKKFLQVSTDGKYEMAAKALAGKTPLAKETIKKLWPVFKRVPLANLIGGVAVPALSLGAGILAPPIAIGASSWWRKPNASSQSTNASSQSTTDHNNSPSEDNQESAAQGTYSAADNNNSPVEDSQEYATRGRYSHTDRAIADFMEHDGPVTLPGQSNTYYPANNNNQYY